MTAPTEEPPTEEELAGLAVWANVHAQRHTFLVLTKRGDPDALGVFSEIENIVCRLIDAYRPQRAQLEEAVRLLRHSGYHGYDVGFGPIGVLELRHYQSGKQNGCPSCGFVLDNLGSDFLDHYKEGQ